MQQVISSYQTRCRMLEDKILLDKNASQSPLALGAKALLCTKIVEFVGVSDDFVF